MRPHVSMIISLIFIFNLLATTQTYGSTLEKKINAARGSNSIFNAALHFLSQRIGFDEEDVVRKEALCLNQGQSHCLGKGRKLLMKSPLVSTSTKDKIKKDEASPTSKRDNMKPDVMDIAGMDYSPAKRKPPIHN